LDNKINKEEEEEEVEDKIILLIEIKLRINEVDNKDFKYKE
jgi:hypothetical protein